MAVQLTISYETLVELIEQLPESQKSDLFTQLANQRHQSLAAVEWVEQFNALRSSAKINEAPSIRREDWYGDDGR